MLATSIRLWRTRTSNNWRRRWESRQKRPSKFRKFSVRTVIFSDSNVLSIIPSSSSDSISSPWCESEVYRETALLDNWPTRIASCSTLTSNLPTSSVSSTIWRLGLRIKRVSVFWRASSSKPKLNRFQHSPLKCTPSGSWKNSFRRSSDGLCYAYEFLWDLMSD